jgi:hypothetical protein
MRNSCRCAIVVSTLVGLPAGAWAQTLSFTDATDELGLAFTHTRGPRYGFMGAGGAAADFDNDGYVDLFVLGGGLRADALFINNGPDAEGHFSFTDEAAAWGLGFPHYSFGVSAADYNKDGLIDLYITSFGDPANGMGPGRHKLLTNLGPGAGGQWSFVNEAELCGVNSLSIGSTDGTGSAWGDYDLDGDLDLVVCAYVSTEMGNRMFRNDGPVGGASWTFTDVTAQAGFLRTGIEGFVPGFADLNNDLYPELLLVADIGTSLYLVNNHDGTFTDFVDDCPGLDQANGMGSAVGDVNNDGLLDWYVSGSYYEFLHGPGNVLLVQQPGGAFINAAPGTPIHDGGWGWGVLMVDLDHDGLLDLVETNGFSTGFTNEQSYLYMNHGSLNFTEEAIARGFVHYGQGRGLVDFDFDNDGDRDMVIFSTGEPMAVFENHLLEPGGAVPAGAHWLDLRFDTARRDGLAPMGLGARVTVVSDGQSRVFYADGGFNHCSQSETGVHVGLAGQASADVVRVRWADGTFTTLTGVAGDRRLTVVAPYHPADLNGSGAVDFVDVQWFLQRFSAGDLAADHNGDGLLDIFDVVRFLADFSDAD